MTRYFYNLIDTQKSEAAVLFPVLIPAGSLTDKLGCHLWHCREGRGQTEADQGGGQHVKHTLGRQEERQEVETGTETGTETKTQVETETENGKVLLRWGLRPRL